MGIETIEKDLGNGARFRITQLGAKQGSKVFTRLVKRFGPSIAELAKGFEGGVESLADVDVSAVGSAIERFTDKLTDDDVTYLCDTFALRCEVQIGDPSEDRWVPLDRNFDHYFAAKYGLMLRWLWACMEVNFADFFAESSGAGFLARAAAMRTARSKSPTSSPGISGDPLSVA